MTRTVNVSSQIALLSIGIFVALLPHSVAGGSVDMEYLPEDPYLSGNASQPVFRSVDIGGHCRGVRHWGSQSYFIPTNTVTEWVSMINHKPPSIEMKSCNYVWRCPAGSYYHLLAISLPIGGCEPCVGGPGSIGGPTIGAAATDSINSSNRAAACS